MMTPAAPAAAPTRAAMAHEPFPLAWRGRSLPRAILAGLFCLILLAPLGCAKQSPKAENPPSAAPSLPWTSLNKGVWEFRHNVLLEIPALKVSQSFDGLLRLDLAKGEAHGVGLARLGLRLFDMTVTRSGATTALLHPGFARLPRAEEQIALCLRRIFLYCLVATPPEAEAAQKAETVMNAVSPEGTLLRCQFKQRQAVRCTGEGGGESWTLTPSYADAHMLWPESLRFDNARLGYSLTVRFLETRQYD